MYKKYLVLPVTLLALGSVSLHAVRLHLSVFGVPIYTYDTEIPKKQASTNFDRYLQELARQEVAQGINDTNLLSDECKTPPVGLKWRGLAPEFTFRGYKPYIHKKADATTTATIREALKQMGEQQSSAVPAYAFRKDHSSLGGKTDMNGIYISEHNRKYTMYHEAAHWFHRHPHKAIEHLAQSHTDFTLNANPLKGAVAGLVLRGLFGYFGVPAKLQQCGVSAQASQNIINGLCLTIGLQQTFDWQSNDRDVEKGMAYMLKCEKEADRTALETLITYGMINEVADVVTDFNNTMLNEASDLIEEAQNQVNPQAHAQPIHSYFKDYQLADFLKTMPEADSWKEQRCALEKHYLNVVRAAHKQEQAGKSVDYKAIVDALRQNQEHE